MALQSLCAAFRSQLKVSALSRPFAIRSVATSSLSHDAEPSTAQYPKPPEGFTNFNKHPLDYAPGFVNPYEEKRVPWPSVKVTGYRMRLALKEGFKDEELEEAGIPKDYWPVFKDHDNLPKRKMVKTALDTFGEDEHDTGRTEVQVAIYTSRIAAITDHLKAHKKDFSSRRGMMLLIGRRRRLLRYLEREDPVRYFKCIQALKLRPLRNLYAKNTARYELLAKRGKDK
eukprot:TRINITY_DN5063_c0_g1_i2.p1 TRINITY_DN5063_c0_g1~~TRINITY_DN5063_c0_g1_i2.p1  ORF type:complete len:228 (-),score=46.13 TRINITY_DN5063_c0_g1_i2:85-768(-)